MFSSCEWEIVVKGKVCIMSQVAHQHVVSSAAVFWDVTQRSPQRNGCSHPNNILFLYVCGLFALC